MTSTSNIDSVAVESFLALDWVQNEEDKISKNLYSVKGWIGYIDVIDDRINEEEKKKNNSNKQKQEITTTTTNLFVLRDWVGRRSVLHLPRSYKLWKLVWEFLLRQYNNNNNSNNSSNSTTGSSSTTTIITPSTIISCFERAILTLSAYPKVWIEYIQFIFTTATSINYTQIRRLCNRALQSVAITQHDKLWNIITEHLLKVDNNNNDNNILYRFIPWETCNRLLERYCTIKPEFVSEYASWCEKHGKFGKAAVAYQELLNRSNSTINDEQHWQSFCELVAQHSISVENAGIAWEAILKTAIRTQKEEANTQLASKSDSLIIEKKSSTSTTMLGLLYSWLASAWIQRGSFDMARSVYEEGLLTVRTVRDFSILYSAYLQLEEGLLTSITDSMEDLDDIDEMDNDEDNKEQTTNNKDDTDWDLLLPSKETSTSKLAEMELAMARAEHLTARRPLLLNAVKLRQNPNDCEEWVQRGNLFIEAEQPSAAIASLLEAIQTAKGPLSQIVIRLVSIYEDTMNDVAAARDLLDRVCRQRTTALGIYKMEELAECWATWIELELKHEAWHDALSLARQAVATRSGRLHLTKSLRLWDLLLDLEESLGTIQTTKDAYNRSIETKVATVQHILNYGDFLTEHKYFEESLTAYERGIELFAFPHAGAKLLWKAYLQAFLNRYKGSKVERARNLFDQCLKDCPAEECAEFFMINGEFEEEHGLTKRALSVYSNMCNRVTEAERYTAYQLYIAKTTKYLGLAATRDIYQEAIEQLKTDPVSAVKMCRDFAEMESNLKEYDRARGIYVYGAQSADPRRIPEYWKDWNDFEIAHGNEETFREMLRIKRTTQAAFSTVNYNAAGMQEKVENFSNEEAMRMIASKEGMDLEENQATKTTSNVSGFVPSKRKAASAATSLDDVEERVAKLRKATGGATSEQDKRDDDAAAEADEDEIDLDDIDAEIEEAAAEGEMEEEKKKISNNNIDDITTKAIPDSVFGGLAAQKASGS